MARLGDYIQQVNVRNKDLKVTKLVGLTIDKKFIPSVANVIGTDLSNYKVIKHEQFACSLMQVSRDGKMPIAMFEEGEAIMSPAYPMFEVKDKTHLMPQYLMMWFMRSEFDREASFYAVGGVRGSLTWEDFCDMQLPIPNIEKQRELVSEYTTLTQRISLNESLISALESTAQTLYRQTFVTNIDPENLPAGWKMGTIGDFGKIITGGTPPTIDDSNYGNYMPFITIPDMHDNMFIYHTIRMLSKKGCEFQKTRIIPKDSICVSCIGTSGLVSITTECSQTNQQINSIILDDKEYLYYVYFVVSGLSRTIGEYGMGGAVLNNLNKSQFSNLSVIIPSKNVIYSFQKDVSSLMNILKSKIQELRILEDMKSLILMNINS